MSEFLLSLVPFSFVVFASFCLSEHNFPPYTWRRWVLESRLTLFHFDNERGGKRERENMNE